MKMIMKTRIVSLILTALLLATCNNPFVDTLLPDEPEKPIPLFMVYIPSSSGGRIVANPPEAVDVGVEFGTPISLTVTINDGYTLGEVSLRIEREDSPTNLILPKPYTFSMYDSDVTVRAKFTKIEVPSYDDLFLYEEDSEGAYTYSMRRILDESVDDTFQFPYGKEDASTLMEHSYWLGNTEVSFTLWQVVRDWAKARSDGRYTFTNANAGVSGGGATGGAGTHPVSSIGWYDALVWCNALTEWYNEKYQTELAPVYQNEDGEVLRNATATAALDAVQPKDGANGFRLPTGEEWELAARWRKDAFKNAENFTNAESYTSYFTPGQYASGVNRDGTDTGQVAVYNTTGTAPVKSRRPNDLGIYDMSGNVAEICFDPHSSKDDYRIVKGQAWSDTSLSIGEATILTEDNTIGFRIARTSAAKPAEPANTEEPEEEDE
jgi:formylglycine-generating enzyme required for sulfatase activity